jgi:hypothetical protein
MTTYREVQKQVQFIMLKNNKLNRIPLNSDKETLKKYIEKNKNIEVQVKGGEINGVKYYIDNHGSYIFKTQHMPNELFTIEERTKYVKDFISDVLEDLKLKEDRYYYQMDFYYGNNVAPAYGELLDTYTNWSMPEEGYSGNSLIEERKVDFTISLRKVPNGMGGGVFTNVYSEADIKRKRCIIYNKAVTMCPVVASYHGLRYALNKSDGQSLSNHMDKYLTEQAALICEKVKHNPLKTWTFQDLNKLADYYTKLESKDVRIVVIDSNAAMLYDTSGMYNIGTEEDIRIYLLHFEEHFHLVWNPQGMKSNKYFCKPCHVYSDSRSAHNCYTSVCTICDEKIHNRNPKCPKCEKKPCINCEHECFKTKRIYNPKYWCLTCDKPITSPAKCNSCNLKMCNKHEHECENTTTTCDNCHVLIKCFNHDCEKRVCPCCKKEVYLEKHCCYIQKTKLKSHVKTVLYYDIECAQDENGVHYPVLVCVKFKNEELVFNNVTEFCTYLFSIKEPITIVAHNQRGYDGYFILEYLLAHDHKPVIIMQGSKLMYMKVGKLYRFVDSYSHIPIPLRDFAATFNLQSTKGDFPYKLISRNYNSEEHEWIQNMPHIKYYQCYKDETIDEYVKYLTDGTITPLIYAAGILEGVYTDQFHYLPDEHNVIIDDYYRKSDIELIKWYHESLNSSTKWNYHDEILSYCKQDVSILEQGMESMREITKDTLDSDPLSYVTLASHCHSVYTSLFMPESSIPINLDDFNLHYKRSYKANSWLLYIEKELGYSIHREYKVSKNIVVDGYDPKTKTAYEFNGCFWHGCAQCYPKGVNSVNHTSYAALYDKTKKKEIALKKLCKVDSIWEHSFDALKKSGFQYPEPSPESLPLAAKDSMFGGRTEPFIATNSPGEKIQYVDFTSLYPYIQQTKEYPTGRSGRNENVNSKTVWNPDWFGFAKIKIIPPTDLLYPVLPHSGDKLYFDLYPKIGTWATPEINKAIEMGYVIDKIYSLQLYESRRTDLFVEYVDFWMKIKDESSGWPTNDPDERIKYVESKHADGIKIDPDKIKKNKGLRSISKLFLNSLWGKFGQNLDTVETHFVKTKEEYFSLISNNRRHRVDNVNDKTVIIKLSAKEIPTYKTSLCVAVFTTAHARLHLYKSIEDACKLPNAKIYYCDTDSMFISADTEMPTSQKVGDLKNELQELGPDAYIDQFITLGAKTYGYTIRYTGQDGFKHISTNMKSKGVHNPKYGMNELLKVLNQKDATISNIPSMTFKKNYKGETMTTVYGTKTIGNTLNKREFNPDDVTSMSVPYNYKT